MFWSDDKELYAIRWNSLKIFIFFIFFSILDVNAFWWVKKLKLYLFYIIIIIIAK